MVIAKLETLLRLINYNNMTTFFVKFAWMKPYPRDFSTRVEAGNMGTAVNRATRELKKQNNVRGLKELAIKVIKL